jgi:hypothetical protein
MKSSVWFGGRDIPDAAWGAVYPGTRPARDQLRQLPYYGFWGMAHEARTDWAMLLGSISLLVVGAGAWSLDARLMSKLRPLPSYRQRP